MKLHVPNITCEHCERTIVRTLQLLDVQGRVVVDLASKTVDVEGALSVEQVTAALAAQDYPATLVSTTPTSDRQAAANCCGKCRV